MSNSIECAACGHTNRAEAKFCEECGTPVSLICGQCSAELRPNAKFCDRCGHAVAHPAKGHGAALEPARSGRAEGERRIVSVLFADAAGHTTTSEQLDEEDVYNLMQGCFARMQQAVERYGGNVNQYTGDGILALFGAPVAYEDSARRAVAAGLEMQELLEAYSKEIAKKHPVTCRFRVGVNSGPVVIGSISEKLDLDLAAVGDTVNLASRMQTLAEPGTVYLTESAFNAARDSIDCVCLGPMAIKGKARTVTVYRAVEVRKAYSRIGAALDRGLTPYVGREHEQEMLHAYLEKAEEGHGQVVLISGEAGIGKSRTVYEFRRLLQNRPLRWLEGQCISFGENIPYLPAIDILKSAFAVADGDSAENVAEKIALGVSGWSENAKQFVPYIRYLLGVAQPGDKVVDLDPRERRAGFFDAFRAVVRESAKDARVVIAVEDLHWIDERSDEILRAMVDAIAGLPVLVLLTARPGYRSSLGDRLHVNRISLTHLKRDDGLRLAEQALGAEGLPSELHQLIAGKAEGNPFYIEEVIRSLVESGAIRKEGATYAIETSVDRIHIPNTIHEVILARIDRLQPAAKEAMQLASVIGREFTARLLNRISDLEDALSDTLEELKSLELIYESGYLPELSYMFKHALTHDVAYSTLLHERRRHLHRTVASAIELLFEDRLSEHYEALAHHYEAAEEWERALDYLAKSAVKSAHAFANAEAIGFYSRAVDVARRLGRNAQPGLERLLEERAAVHQNRDDFSLAIKDIEELTAIAHERGDSETECKLFARLGELHWLAHNNEESLSALEKARTMAEGLSNEAKFGANLVSAAMLGSLGRTEEAEGFYAQANPLVLECKNARLRGLWVAEVALFSNWRGEHQKVLEHIDRYESFTEGMAYISAFVQWLRSLALASLGRYGEAFHCGHEALEYAQRIESGFWGQRVLNTLGWFHSEVFNLDESRRWNERCLEGSVSGQFADVEVEFNARLNLVEACYASHRIDEAKAHLDAVEPVARNPEPKQLLGHTNYAMRYFLLAGEYALLTGNPEGAFAGVEECLAIARRTKRPKYVLRAQRLRGRALTVLGELGEAESAVIGALETARQLENPSQLWRAYAELGRIYNALKDDAKESEARDRAARTIRQMGESLETSQRDTFYAHPAIRAATEGTAPYSI